MKGGVESRLFSSKTLLSLAVRKNFSFSAHCKRLKHNAEKTVAQTNAHKPAGFYSDKMRWPHVGARWVTKALALFPVVSESLKEDSSLPSTALPSNSQIGASKGAQPQQGAGLQSSSPR